MSFVVPWMLLGLVAASAPIILHLLRKRTAERVLWGAWMFLKESMQRKRRKLMIEDIILLVLRTLVIVFAVFAFARPFLPELHLFGSKGMDKDVVIVLDTSASMRLPDATGRLGIARALEEARELVKLSPKGTAFGVVLGDRQPTILTASPISSKREVLDLLEKIEAGEDTMDAPRTLAAAGQVLAAGNNPAKEVIVFGDGQAYGWRPDDAAEWGRVERLFARFQRRPPVIWRALERPEHVKNAAIASVIPSRRIVGTDRPLTFSVTVVNSGSEAFSPGDTVLTLDGAEIARAPVGQILPGLSRTFEFPCSFETKGRHEVVASLSLPDDIASDSTVTNPVDVVESLDVLLVNGRPSETGFKRPTAFLDAALRPEIRGTNAVFLVRPRTVRAAELEKPETFNGIAATVLCDVPFLSPKATTNLTKWVKAGGGLLTVPGVKAQTDFYTNDVFSVAWTNWNDRLRDVTFSKAPVAARVEFDEFALTNGIDVAERFSDGSAAIVTARYGKGRTAISAFPFDLDTTAFPARPDFVPFAHELVYSIAGTNSFPVTTDLKWRAREGDLTPLDAEATDAISVSIDLGYARSADDALAAIVGRSFGVEICRPLGIVALLLLIAELLLCRRLDNERGGAVPSRARLVLRTLAFLALLWMLLQISCTHDVIRTIHRRVAVFTDASLSMMRADADADGQTNGVVRYETATNVAAMLEKNLGKRYDVEPFAFGGERTDYAAALEQALDRIPSEELAGAVFVTDGRSTTETGPEAAARRFARLGAKVSTVLVGNVTNRADAAIELVRAPETVFLGDKVRPSVRVRADGMNGKAIVVKLMEGDNQIAVREFQPDSDAWTKEFRFAHDPEGKGLKNYRVEIVAPEGDSETSNDTWPFDVSVSDDRTNVLLADRRPRWEFRYLRNLFYGRDKSVHLQYVLTEPDRLAGVRTKPAPAADATREFGDAEAGGLPQTRDDWRKFDVIILGDLGPDVLTEEACEDIRWCVEERGAMLVLTAGDRFMPYVYAKGPLANLLPVGFTNEMGQVTAEWSVGKAPFALSPSGRGHPTTSIAASASETDRIWNSLPPTSGHLAGLTVKPGSDVLLFAGNSTCLDAPLMTVRETGRGKTVFFATDELWLLRYRVGDTHHHRFWGNLMKWGSGEKLRDGNVFARAGADRLHYQPEDEVKLMVRLSDKDALPIETAHPTAEIKRPDGTVSTVDLVKREGANGYYEAKLDATALEGRYEVTVSAPEAKEILGEDWPDPLTTSFSVDRGIAPVEYAHLSADDKVVGEMARLTGGCVRRPDAFDDLGEAFGSARSEITEHIEDPIWDHPLALTLLVLALIAVWILRKRRGLA